MPVVFVCARDHNENRIYPGIFFGGGGMSRETHPVWTVYDKLRTARLNVKYYSCRLQRIERWNFFIELVLAIAAPTSAVAGLWFWNLTYGKLAWRYLGIIAAAAAVLKPPLSLAKRIKDYESVLSGYRMLDFDLMEMKCLIEQRQKYDSGLQAEFKRILQREKTLVGKTPETRENERVKKACKREVLRELPKESFFIPEEYNNATV
jgi:hypothetical protein